MDASSPFFGTEVSDGEFAKKLGSATCMVPAARYDDFLIPAHHTQLLKASGNTNTALVFASPTGSGARPSSGNDLAASRGQSTPLASSSLLTQALQPYDSGVRVDIGSMLRNLASAKSTISAPFVHQQLRDRLRAGRAESGRLKTLRDRAKQDEFLYPVQAAPAATDNSEAPADDLDTDSVLLSVHQGLASGGDLVKCKIPAQTTAPPASSNTSFKYDKSELVIRPLLHLYNDQSLLAAGQQLSEPAAGLTNPSTPCVQMQSKQPRCCASSLGQPRRATPASTCSLPSVLQGSSSSSSGNSSSQSSSLAGGMPSPRSRQISFDTQLQAAVAAATQHATTAAASPVSPAVGSATCASHHAAAGMPSINEREELEQLLMLFSTCWHTPASARGRMYASLNHVHDAPQELAACSGAAAAHSWRRVQAWSASCAAWLNGRLQGAGRA